MTPARIAQLETAELERWYRLPSPSPRPAHTDALTAFGLCLACVVFVLIAQAQGA